MLEEREKKHSQNKTWEEKLVLEDEIFIRWLTANNHTMKIKIKYQQYKQLPVESDFNCK